MKKCPQCNEESDNFSPKGRRCRPCGAKRQREWRARNPEKLKEINRAYAQSENGRERQRASKRKHYLKVAHTQRLRLYGIAPEEFKRLLKEQAGTCAICRKPETATLNGKVKNLHVDHDHATGIVRGLLCGKCNVGIGMFDECQEKIAAAAAYLKRD